MFSNVYPSSGSQQQQAPTGATTESAASNSSAATVGGGGGMMNTPAPFGVGGATQPFPQGGSSSSSALFPNPTNPAVQAETRREDQRGCGGEYVGPNHSLFHRVAERRGIGSNDDDLRDVISRPPGARYDPPYPTAGVLPEGQIQRIPSRGGGGAAPTIIGGGDPNNDIEPMYGVGGGVGPGAGGSGCIGYPGNMPLPPPHRGLVFPGEMRGRGGRGGVGPDGPPFGVDDEDADNLDELQQQQLLGQLGGRGGRGTLRGRGFGSGVGGPPTGFGGGGGII